MGQKKILRKALKEMIHFLQESDEEVYNGTCECENEEYRVCDDCQGSDEEDINQGHYFELMDRTHVIQSNIQDHIQDHPAMTPEIEKKIVQAQDLLTDVYQWASYKWDDFYKEEDFEE